MYLHARALEFYSFPQTPNNIIINSAPKINVAPEVELAPKVYKMHLKDEKKGILGAKPVYG